MRRACLLFALLGFAIHTHVYAQRPGIGIGFSGVASTQSPPLGMGFETRASWPVNLDFSIGGGVGFIGYIFGGRDSASYFVTPNVFAIVTFDASNVRSPYLIAGFGGYFPVASGFRREDAGPTVHAGLGWTTILNATAIYIEVSPTLVIARSTATMLLPLRIGIVI